MPRSSRKSQKKSSSFITKVAKGIVNLRTIKTVFGMVFVVLGLIFLFTVPIPSIPKEEMQAKEPIAAGKEFVANKKESQVKRIIISKRDIDLDVTPAKIVKGYWETRKTGASHGEGTANPGEHGNVVIFAHAREGMFYNLKDIKKDDIVYVLTRDRWYRYKVNEIKTVYPRNIETVAPTDHEVLTLFTCSGFFDEKRLIVKALPI